MSQKQMKRLRREFRKVHGADKPVEYELNYKNVKKTITRHDANLLAKRGVDDAPEGKEYIKRTARILADERRRQYQADKAIFKHGK